MLKPLCVALIATFLFVVPEIYAHTYLDSTNPSDGSTITQDLQTISLNYSGIIEQGSTFSVRTSSGSEIPLDSITVHEGVLSGTFASPLPNDTYTVEWDSISQDGHPLSGSFSFTVNHPTAAETAEGKIPGADTDQKIESDVTGLVDTLQTDTDTENGFSFWVLVVVLTVIVLALGGFSAYSYKRSFVKRKKEQ